MEELIKKLNEYQETGAIGYSVYVDLITTTRMAQVENENEFKKE